MRIVAWNIQHGGGKRGPQIASAINGWNPDVVCLTEFRGTKASQQIAQRLSEAGWHHQLSSTCHEQTRKNGLLVASKTILEPIRTQQAPVPHRFLPVRLPSHGLALGLLHIPNRESGSKYTFHDFILDWTANWLGGPAIILGDTNTGEPGIDEESKFFNRKEGHWMRSLRDLRWQDAWRALHGDQRVYSWREPRLRNGFRIDQAFLNPPTLKQLRSVSYDWATLENGKNPSDHAALILDLEESTP